MMVRLIQLIILALCTKKAVLLEKILTINIDPGKEDCFFQYIKEGETIDLDYQVIDGGHGDLDITFHVSEPSGRRLHMDIKKYENNYQIGAEQTGDYKFCFDNTFSSFNSKIVFFELFVENDNWGNGEHIDFNLVEGDSVDEVYDLKIQDIMQIIEKVRVHLTKARHMQDLFKSYEARDRNIAEENNFKVNSFSLFQVIIMVTVGIIQVIMVRSLFDDRSKVSKIWKKLESKR